MWPYVHQPYFLDGCGRSIAHFALAGGCIACLRWLRECNIPLDTQDSEGKLPFDYAAEMGQLSLLQQLHKDGLLKGWLKEQQAQHQ